MREISCQSKEIHSVLMWLKKSWRKTASQLHKNRFCEHQYLIQPQASQINVRHVGSSTYGNFYLLRRMAKINGDYRRILVKKSFFKYITHRNRERISSIKLLVVQNFQNTKNSPSFCLQLHTVTLVSLLSPTEYEDSRSDGLLKIESSAANQTTAFVIERQQIYATELVGFYTSFFGFTIIVAPFTSRRIIS